MDTVPDGKTSATPQSGKRPYVNKNVLGGIEAFNTSDARITAINVNNVHASKMKR